MAAVTHIVGSAAHSSSSSVSPPPPWHPVILVPSRQARHHHHHHHHQVLHDLDLAMPSPFPSPTTPAATGTASPLRPNNNHNHLRPASSRQRAACKPRRPRPSRKQPITYISADAASFRRMVHQVTGFDHDVHLHGGPVAAPGPEVLYRQAPTAPLSRDALTMTETMLLPTLDTSAFLMLGAAGGDSRGRGGAAPARPPGVSSCCHGSSSVVEAVDTGAAAALQVKAEAASGGGRGFPSLEPWDEDDALFLEFARR